MKDREPAKEPGELASGLGLEKVLRSKHYAKTGEKKWVFQEYDGVEETVELAAIPFTIALHEIYDKVEFEPVEQPEESSTE